MIWTQGNCIGSSEFSWNFLIRVPQIVKDQRHEISFHNYLKKCFSFPNRLTNIERSSCQNRIAQDSATIWNVGWFGRETLFCRCCQVIRTIHGLHFLISRPFENPKRMHSALFSPEAFRNAVMQRDRQVLNTGSDSI